MHTSVEDGIRTEIYQIECLHKKFDEPINVVIIVKINEKTGKRAHTILFSSGLSLPWKELVTYYSLRFQIEFNFRDAKQFWGLEDFMVTKKLPVENAASLAFFMVNLFHILKLQPQFLGMSVLDLKAWFRAERYVHETLKFFPETHKDILIQPIVERVAGLGRINPPQSPT